MRVLLCESSRSSLLPSPPRFQDFSEQIDQDREDHACADSHLHEQGIVESIATRRRIKNSTKQLHPVDQTRKNVANAGRSIKNDLFQGLDEPGEFECHAVDLSVDGTVSVDDR